MILRLSLLVFLLEYEHDCHHTSEMSEPTSVELTRMHVVARNLPYGIESARPRGDDFEVDLPISFGLDRIVPLDVPASIGQWKESDHRDNNRPHTSADTTRLRKVVGLIGLVATFVAGGLAVRTRPSRCEGLHRPETTAQLTQSWYKNDLASVESWPVVDCERLVPCPNLGAPWNVPLAPFGVRSNDGGHRGRIFPPWIEEINDSELYP
eukprot:scaffold184_cov179-Amphora_coffeaeformis.AAC.10